MSEQQTSTYNLDDWLHQTGQEIPDQDSERWVSYTLQDLYPDWQQKAHCAGVGVSYYFGDGDEQPTMSISERRRASKLCEVCPVFKECLTWALTIREEYGIWAGTSGMVRRRIFKMMDNGETTVDEVVERFCNGQGDTYRLPQKAEVASGSGKAPAQEQAGRGVGERHEGVRAAVGREATG